MRIRPPGITDEMITRVLAEEWNLAVAQPEYAPVGFGSHHWTVSALTGDHYFLTLDVFDRDVDARRSGLAAAMRAARLVADRLPEAVGPIFTSSGDVLARLGSAAVTLFPALTLRETAGAKDRPEVIELLGRLHALTADVGVGIRAVAGTDQLQIRRRDQLERTLAKGEVDHRVGPFAEPLASALDAHADVVITSLQRYDDLAARAGLDRSGWVITHGEPHPGNLLTTPNGLRLVDWDSALLAPAARDLADFSTDAVTRYVETTGRAVPAGELELYRLRWELDEVAEYTSWFSRVHVRDADTEIAWGGLQTALAKLTAWNAERSTDRDPG